MRETLGAAFDRSLALHGDRDALEFGGERISYAALGRWVRRICDCLVAQGVGAGDVVALLLGNRPEFVACDIAIARLAAVKLPVNQLLPAATVSHILADGGARMVVVGPELVDLARAALDGDGTIAVLQAADDGAMLLEGAQRLPSLGESGEGDGRPAAIAVPADAPAALYYTGGTTGLPKGVLHSQRSLMSFHIAQLLEAEIRQHDRLLLMTPLAHAAGLFAQSAILRGATIVLRDGFDLQDALRALREESVSWTFLVPTMIYRLLDAIERQGGSSFPQLDTIVYGAAPISPARLEQALRVFGPVFLQLYGQTECPNWGTRLAKADHDVARPKRLASCGQASLLVDVKIVDDAGDDLPVGEVGEICLRGPYTLSRYHRDEQATREKFLGDWIRTGDIGLLDQDGYLYLKDRRADMVISGGMNVYCREVEDVLNAHPGVRSAAVFSVPHEDWGEAVHAVVVGSEGLTGDDLLVWSRERLAAYACPKTVEFVESLPETPFGKIDKKRLRAPFWKGSDRAIH